MKFFDRYKLSLHNINNNKSRSILTTTIVFIISLLMIFILSIAINFSQNFIKIVADYYQKSGEEIIVDYFGNNEDGYHLDLNAYEQIKNVIIENEETISYTRYETNNYVNLYLQNHRFSGAGDIEIIEGRNTNSNDENTNKVLISASFVNEYYNEFNILLKPGSTFDYEFTEYFEEDSKRHDFQFEVVGIFKQIEKKDYWYNSNKNIIVDLEYFLNQVENSYIVSFNYYYLASNTNFNKEEFQSNLQKLTDQLNSIIPKINDYNAVRCWALEDLKMTNIVSMIVYIFGAFLSLVLILLSIGSLANTIMISVDKNKKFIGLLKALGLNEKDLKSTIKMESITTITMGVLLAFLVLYLAKGPISNINELIIQSMFSMYLSEIDYQITFNFYIFVPVIVLIFFVLFTLLFSRSSMSRIAKLDPMAVISEVS